MNRLEALRRKVDIILMSLNDTDRTSFGFIHLYGVSLYSAMLAEKRNLNVEIAMTAGMLHDLSTYQTGCSKGHAPKGSRLAREILEESGLYNNDEMDIIASAIKNHSNKVEVHDEYSELLKDADVLHHHYYNPLLDDFAHEGERLNKCLDELAWK